MAARYGRSLGSLLQLSRCRWSVVAGGGGGGREARRFSLRNVSSAQPATAKETASADGVPNPNPRWELAVEGSWCVAWCRVWVTINFILPDGKRKEARAKLGDSLLDVVIDNNLDIDGYGACEGTLACSTCHIIFKEEHFKKISAKLTDEELDMLDLAYGLTDTSRLGCQILVTKEMEGWEVMVPAGFADARS